MNTIMLAAFIGAIGGLVGYGRSPETAVVGIVGGACVAVVTLLAIIAIFIAVGWIKP